MSDQCFGMLFRPRVWLALPIPQLLWQLLATDFFEEPVQGTWSTSDLLSLEWMVLGISRLLINSQISAVFGLPLGINLSWPTGLTGARDDSTSQIISLQYHWIITGLVTCVPGIFEISTSEYYPLPTSSRYWETSTIDFQFAFPIKQTPLRQAACALYRTEDPETLEWGELYVL